MPPPGILGTERFANTKRPRTNIPYFAWRLLFCIASRQNAGGSLCTRIYHAAIPSYLSRAADVRRGNTFVTKAALTLLLNYVHGPPLCNIINLSSTGSVSKPHPLFFVPSVLLWDAVPKANRVILTLLVHRTTLFSCCTGFIIP